jgi:hypothetical protein
VDDSEHEGTVWDAVARIARLGTPAPPRPDPRLLSATEPRPPLPPAPLPLTPTYPHRPRARARGPSDGHPPPRTRRYARLSAIAGTGDWGEGSTQAGGHGPVAGWVLRHRETPTERMRNQRLRSMRPEF